MKIRITGPESSGKSSLSHQLTWALDGICVAEQARPYLAKLRRPYRESDLLQIWRQQLAAEAAAELHAAAFLMCDTGPEVIRIWSEVKFDRCHPEIIAATGAARYDLTFLCYPDLPWQADPMREHPDPADRVALFDRYRSLLPDATVIRGADRAGDALRRVWKELGR